MVNDRANWKVRFDTFLTHIRHDIEKGIDNQVYNWQNIRIERNDDTIAVFQTNNAKGIYPLNALGSAEQHSQDNRISLNLDLKMLNSNATMTQHKNGNNATTTKTVQENNTMKNSTRIELSSLVSTVGAQFKEAGVVSLKTKTGEALLKAVENLVLEKAGFIGRVKFKFMPEALDIMVAGGVSVLVAEYAGQNHAAVIGAEALRLAAMRRVTDLLPITEIVDTLTKGGATLETLTKNV